MPFSTSVPFAAVLSVVLVRLASASFVSATFDSIASNVNLVGTSFGIPGLNASFDYVVIGGGTAGLVMAARLAENKTNSVAVIEAGGIYQVDNGNLSVIPSDGTWFCGADPADTQPLVDWGFVTAPQPGIDQREVHYARGKTLGGSSARNFLAYQRGTNDSYKLWAQQVGDPTYEFPSLLEYFRKSVQWTPPNAALRPANASVPPPTPGAFSSSGGPLHVTVPNYANTFAGWMRNGILELGLRPIQDYVSGTLIGSQFNYHTERPSDQSRSSSESSFLEQALATTDLAVYKNTLAKRIVFDANKKATGVLVNTAGMTFQLNATKEVILSAGTFQSPQLLMVSGIGPKDTLEENNISCVAELPGVGQNMWDHWFFGPSYQVNVPSHSRLANQTYAAQAAAQYRVNHTGMLTNIGGDILGWEKLPYPERSSLSNATQTLLQDTFPPDWPEIEYISLDGYVGTQSNYITGGPQNNNFYVGATAALVAPFSRGNVTITSPDTSVLPVISPNWLVEQADQEVAIAAYKRLRQIIATKATSPVIIGQEVYPGPNVTSDADILEAIKQGGMTVWHAAGTCKMGMANDTMAVVDSRARVLGGVSGLRVVDASAFPFLPPGHPQSTIYALAEKIADDIMTGR